ncbi:hypothetical protein ACEPPN_008977 [Leptodophora sp. 'Broadleaf-Isolate-01']
MITGRAWYFALSRNAFDLRSWCGIAAQGVKQSNSDLTNENGRKVLAIWSSHSHEYHFSILLLPPPAQMAEEQQIPHTM